MSTMSDFVNSGASNQAQVDANTKALSAITGRNKIINGHMIIAQRGTSFAAIANNAFSADRWFSGHAGASVRTISQDTDAPVDFTNSLKSLITTAVASLTASDYSIISQNIEGFQIIGFIGKTITLSFWVKASKTGVYSVSFRNDALNKSYVAEYTINAANTWEKKTITIINGLDESGTWLRNNGIGVRLLFVIACGTNNTTSSIGVWNNDNKFASANQVNGLDAVNNTFFLTGVQLELGEQATEFEITSVPDEINKCQRYFYRSGNTLFTANNITSAPSPSVVVPLPIRMRVVPAVTMNPLITDANYSNAQPTGNQWALSQLGVGYCTKTGTLGAFTNIGTGVNQVIITFTTATFNVNFNRMQTGGHHIFDASAEL